MAWDFCTDPDVQARLDWADRFVAEEIEPVESLLYDVVDVGRPEGSIAELFEQWRQEVKDQQLYAVHLPPEQGGQGFGEVNLALLNEVIGRSYWAPYVFATGPGTPGSGQSDVLAVFGTDQQKQRWLYPLLEGKITMIYSMTEPHGGADPTGFRCQAVRDGDEWVINGDKFFSSGAEQAELILLMAVTDPDASAYQGMSMFIVPTNAPGVRIFGDLGGLGDDGGVGFGHHPYIRYQDVRVPADHLIGDQGKAFEMAQRRLSAGRMHHAMRAVALAKREFEMICERALSRYTQGGLLAEKQMVQEMVADAWLELTQFRLLILQAAWIIERDGYGAARRYVAACKVKAAEIQREMAYKATHIHGALGTTNTLPITRGTDWLGIADGPTEVHKVTLARQVLRDYQPSQDLWPTRFRPRTLLKARARLDEIAAARLPDAAHSELHELLQTSTNGNDAAIARMTEFMHMTTEEGLYADFDPAARLFPHLGAERERRRSLRQPFVSEKHRRTVGDLAIELGLPRRSVYASTVTAFGGLIAGSVGRLSDRVATLAACGATRGSRVVAARSSRGLVGRAAAGRAAHIGRGGEDGARHGPGCPPSSVGHSFRSFTTGRGCVRRLQNTPSPTWRGCSAAQPAPPETPPVEPASQAADAHPVQRSWRIGRGWSSSCGRAAVMK